MMRRTLHMKFLAPLIIILVLLVLLPSVAYSSPPLEYITFQGVLKNDDGALITGQRDFTLRIHSVAEGGVTGSGDAACTISPTCLWNENQTNIRITNGIFSIQAGNTTAFASFTNFTNALYFEVIVSNSTGTDEILSPRISMVATPFALSASRASVDFDLNQKNIVNASTIEITQTESKDSFRVNDEAGDTTPFIINGTGFVGIGTATPNEKFTMVGGNFLLNSTEPTLTGSLIDSINMNATTSVYVSGKYAYVAASYSDSLSIIDISDPTNPTLTGSLIDSINMNGAYSVYVSGKYAYVAGVFSDSLAIIDISDPTNPTLTGSLIDSTILDGAYSVYVSGKYVYIVSIITDSLSIIDISDPTNPTLTGSLIDSINMNGAYSVYVSGKYAYVAGDLSDSLAIIDISGIDVPSANIGSLQASTLSVTENAIIENNLYSGGLNVGFTGIHSDGAISTFGNMIVHKMLNLENSNILVISGGAVTISKSFHVVGVEGGSSDDLVTINGGSIGDILIITSETSGIDITVKDADGNIQLNGNSSDIVLDHVNDIIVFIYDGTNWLQIASSDNG